MAIWSPYIGQPLDWLLTNRQLLIEELIAGSQLESASAGDVSSTRRLQAGAQARLDQVNIALFAIDPITYPLNLRPTRSVGTIGTVILQKST